MVSLIGHFHLDPNRALDVFLDIFATRLATHYTLFLALLSLSPWAPTLLSGAPPQGSGSTRFDEILVNAEVLSDSAPLDLNKMNEVLARIGGRERFGYVGGGLMRSCTQTARWLCWFFHVRPQS
jgi:hypothetical protein